MQIGSMIREIRKSKLLTLKDVARMTGLTQGLISRVENDKVQPSITSLIAISRALNTPIALLFGEDANRPTSPVLRSIERPVVHTKSGITYYLLSRNVQETQIEMLYVEYEKGATTGVMLTHAGFECGLVLKNFNDIQETDQVEAYTVEKIARTLK